MNTPLLFLENVLLGKNHRLSNRRLHIHWRKKPDIETGKPDIGIAAEEISLPDDLSVRTKKNIERLKREIGDTVFGRSEVMRISGLSASGASELIRKMLAARVIETVKGYGKGKYRFG